MKKENKQIMNEQEFLESVRALPPGLQEATLWMLENIELVRKLTRGKAIPDDRMKKYLDEAYKSKSYYMIAILTFKKMRDQRKKK